MEPSESVQINEKIIAISQWLSRKGITGPLPDYAKVVELTRLMSESTPTANRIARASLFTELTRDNYSEKRVFEQLLVRADQIAQISEPSESKVKEGATAVLLVSLLDDLGREHSKIPLVNTPFCALYNRFFSGPNALIRTFNLSVPKMTPSLLELCSESTTTSTSAQEEAVLSEVMPEKEEGPVSSSSSYAQKEQATIETDIFSYLESDTFKRAEKIVSLAKILETFGGPLPGYGQVLEIMPVIRESVIRREITGRSILASALYGLQFGLLSIAEMSKPDEGGVMKGATAVLLVGIFLDLVAERVISIPVSKVTSIKSRFCVLFNQFFRGPDALARTFNLPYPEFTPYMQNLCSESTSSTFQTPSEEMAVPSEKEESTLHPEERI